MQRIVVTGASRYAANALTRMTAAELADRGIVAVALWSGYLRTDMNGMDEAATPPDEALPGAVDVIDRLDGAAAGTCLLPDGTTQPVVTRPSHG